MRDKVFDIYAYYNAKMLIKGDGNPDDYYVLYERS